MDTVLRLPQFHPDLNPIEQIWGIVKTRIAAKNVTLSCNTFSNWQSKILPLWHWKSGHAETLEEEYTGRKHEMDSIMERITINADDDNDDRIHIFYKPLYSHPRSEVDL